MPTETLSVAPKSPRRERGLLLGSPAILRGGRSRSVLRRRVAALVHREVDESPIRVLHGSWQAKRDAFAEASRASEALDDAIFHKVEAVHGKEGYAAAHFLAEPLYQLTTYYEPRNYVLWGYVEDAYDDDPYQPALDLWKVGAQLGEDEEGYFLFVTDH